MKIRALSVAELNSYIKRIFDSDPILSAVSVIGEISNYKLHSSGHRYFSLKDYDSKINCVMFSRYNANEKLVDGLKVKVTGYVSTYPKDGKYQLYVHTIESVSKGELYDKFEKLKEELKEKGYFNLDNKKDIPKFPKKIGVITSPTGSAVRDVINVISRRSSSTEILIFPVKVQGEDSKFQIQKMIELANKREDIDLIILTRGGGSIEELWSFNEKNVAEAIFNSKIPIISGVGHETDFTIADLVSDLRAPTPSAAAELAVEDEIILKHKLDNIYEKLNRNIIRIIKFKHSKMISKKDLYLSLNRKIDFHISELDFLYDKLKTQINFLIKESRRDLENYRELLNAYNPLEILNRGYIIAENSDGVIKKVSKNLVGEELVLKFINGEATCSVVDVKEDD